MQQDVTGPLAELVRRLDGLGPEPSLIALTRELAAAKLAVADVAAYVAETPGTYHRGAVVRRDRYELLVLTWRPGQGSVPHDHAGSVSAMQVLQGEAREGCWRIADDGYAQWEYETAVHPGEMTAWHDAGVHTIRNPEDAVTALVTVHIYAPPLNDFRRFATRPASLVPVGERHDESVPTVAVVGGGFSGAMTAAQLLRRAKADGVKLHVAIIERRGAVGEGLAYGTRDPAHLLNVPAGRMAAWPDRPDDFVQWASRRYGTVAPGDFLPRQWYGEYVRESLLAAAEEAGPLVKLSIIFDEVRRIARKPGRGWMVSFARKASFPADAVVLAIGHRPPSDPIGKLWSGPRRRFITDPWKPFTTGGIQPNERVAILGSGLTAVDAVLSLAREPRAAPISLISRRGLYPQAHIAPPAAPVDLGPAVAQWLAAPGGVCATALFRALRKEVRTCAKAGGNWRSVIDGVRPHTAALWRAMPAEERRVFLARFRPYWEVHRHRMALAVAGEFESLRKAGKVEILAGGVASAQADDDGVRLYVRKRGDESLIELRADWVVNCTGPAASNNAESNPVIGSLLIHGWVKADALGLGLETTAEGNALDAHGAVAKDLFVVGTLRKPELWESTAVPELRGQAAAVAGAILAGIAETGKRP